MKSLIPLSLLLSSTTYACPSFQGVYTGSCHVTFQGQESVKDMPIGISQQECDKFNFNDLTSNYYTIGKSTLYAGSERKYLKRAEISEDEKTLYLHQTVERKSEKFGNSLSVSTYIFKKLSDTEISYDGETFDLLNGELAVKTSCSSLKKSE